MVKTFNVCHKSEATVQSVIVLIKGAYRTSTRTGINKNISYCYIVKCIDYSIRVPDYPEIYVLHDKRVQEIPGSNANTVL